MEIKGPERAQHLLLFPPSQVGFTAQGNTRRVSQTETRVWGLRFWDREFAGPLVTAQTIWLIKHLFFESLNGFFMEEIYLVISNIPLGELVKFSSQSQQKVHCNIPLTILPSCQYTLFICLQISPLSFSYFFVTLISTLIFRAQTWLGTEIFTYLKIKEIKDTNGFYIYGSSTFEIASKKSLEQ